MTLRDYFAGQVIAQSIQSRVNGLKDGRACYDMQDIPDLAAVDAYQIADAMLAARQPERSAE